MTEPGSVVTILKICPLVISAKDFLVRNMGNGQTRLRASSSLSICIFGKEILGVYYESVRG